MMKSNYKKFTCFLKDEQFVRWQISPDEQLDKHWSAFIDENPHLKDEMDKAAQYLKNTVFGNKTLPLSDKEQLLHNIETYKRKDYKKKRRSRQIYLSLISGAAIIVLLFTLKIFDVPFFQSPETKKEIIVADLLNNIDIQLITSNETTFFDETLQMEFDDKGNVRISEKGDKEQKTIDLGNSKQNKLIVPYGKRTTLTLSDGSKLWLNSGSVLEFPSRFEKDSREITLASGGLYIEVAPDKTRPFSVLTPDIKVKVFGTKFNVTNYANSPKAIVLIEGEVSVQADGAEKVMLSPFEQAVLTDGANFNIQKVEVEKYISWKNGYLIFDNTPLREVLQQIERYYNLSINFEHSGQLNQIICEGKLILSDNIDNVMNTVAFLSKSNYHREDSKIYIFNND